MQLIKYYSIFTALKKIIVISFLFIFLCANTEIGQLLKLPHLIQHFIEHNNSGDSDVSIVDFITIHYNENQQHSNKGKENHQNLPFKTISGSVSIVLAFEKHTEVSFSKENIIFINSIVPFYKEFYISNVFASIWQPPELS